MKRRTLILLAGTVVVLAGCGLRGGLERPGPLWGSGSGADAAADEAPVDPNAPVPIDPPDRH